MNKNTTKLDLCSHVSKKVDSSLTEVKKIVEFFLDEILEDLSKGKRIEIRGFGAFSVKKRNPRIGRNPRTGETVNIPSYKAPHFKFSKEAQNIFDTKKAFK